MSRETRENSLEKQPRLSRRSFLLGAGSAMTAAALSGCGIPTWNKEREILDTPEQVIRRDFETYMRQIGNGIIERLATLPGGARYKGPTEQWGINHTNPEDYYWRETVDNDPVDKNAPYELDVTLEDTQNVTYQPDGYHVTMTASSPTSNGEDGYYVQIDARPIGSWAEKIESMMHAGATVLDIAIEMMRQESGVDVSTVVMYCKDESQSDNYGPSVGGKDLPPIDSDDFNKAATLEEKRQVYQTYVEAMAPLRKQINI